ncbi:hemolysin family protein [Desulfosudis oleivorans]|uniref:CBS domain containing protein n=1 Tax=Desulfosudis oleivorans (strain DSM 6200 / JCM 39069 / Hxd3) TaxID=96561 RepID=A8ZVW0_DESOH|nr:hemolysin family protein [Desulfosudis oleivorans]ABW66669.1 CBS domain containing protein [Desulfosudis oleivorans Hxd3]
MKSIVKKSGWIAACLLLPVVAAGGGVTETAPAGSSGGTDAAAWLVVYVVMALGFSFLCSVAEAVLLSITPSYIEGLKDRQPVLAARLKRLKQDNVDRSLSAILTLNTIAHTVGAIGAGAQATILFGSTWFGLFSAAMTLAILFLSEIVPKTIGAVYWTKLTGPTALFVKTLITILYPIVWLSEKMTKFIAHGKALPVFNKDELIAMARAGAAAGQIRGKESKIIQNLFRFESLKVTDIMTPRSVISALSETMTINDALQQITRTPFSRLPLYRSHIDDITGFVLKDDVLIFAAQKRSSERLKALKRKIVVVPESLSLAALLERLLKERQHIAIVVNEHGGTDGLVTLEDLIETLMGMEIVDETDDVVDMRALARSRWVKRAKAMGLDADLKDQT